MLASTLNRMDSTDIKDYSKQLEDVCNVCKGSNRCKDHTKICLAKKLIFNVARNRYKKTLREEKS